MLREEKKCLFYLVFYKVCFICGGELLLYIVVLSFSLYSFLFFYMGKLEFKRYNISY